jgi:hypothetical protein
VRRVVLIALLLTLGVGGCGPRNPTLEKPGHYGGYTVTVESVDPAAKTALIRYSDDTTATADSSHFPKLKANTMAFADVGFLKDGEADMMHPLIVWYPDADKDGYRYDPNLMVQDGIRPPNTGVYVRGKRIF